MFISYIRSVILYFVLVLAIRMMGKRQIGELEPAEFVVAMLIADLAAVPMQDNGIPLLSGIIPILTVLAIELILSVLAMHFRRFRKFLSGTPVILMENGKILSKNLKKTRVTVDELMQHLRESGILDLNTIQYAILEIDGCISTIVHPRHEPPAAQDMHVKVQAAELPVAVVSDGAVLEKELASIGRDRMWVEQQLRRRHCRLEDVFLLTATRGGNVYLSLREETT